MTKEEFAEKWGIRAAFHEECGQYEYLLRSDECLSDLNTLINEHYYPKEFVEWAYRGLTNIYYCNNKNKWCLAFGDEERYMTTEELFNYWKENEK